MIQVHAGFRNRDSVTRAAYGVPWRPVMSLDTAGPERLSVPGELAHGMSYPTGLG